MQCRGACVPIDYEIEVQSGRFKFVPATIIAYHHYHYSPDRSIHASIYFLLGDLAGDFAPFFFFFFASFSNRFCSALRSSTRR